MKRIARKMLQSLVGLPTYLYYFALYKTKAISKDPHEKHIFLFRDLIPESSLILDVGANLGFVSYHLAQKKGCQIMSFEPISVIYLAPLEQRWRFCGAKKFNGWPAPASRPTSDWII